ncbi:hypothetical protein [Prochlorothrix hollandica]|uniref:Uncharacterized protein n=1 Tax=Prochlorothrix hollandica PCC 9006 = CALU 1027 TaxID=317619 RepID=A0A0M2PYM5_PROHO|nr:hypothetical protein [Prochlorothrix hollandica]KKJ01265.1 hypothetical protein PROH_02555 [Prochlorothrix hollandica PCC 9006 = CALU 1027]
MSQNLDLNELRRIVLETQNMGEDLPSDPSRQVYVDRKGNIVLNPNTEERRTLSQVPLKLWASLSGDRQIVASRFPRNTTEQVIGGVRGWLYNITSALGDLYTLFAYNDGSQYQVLVVFPEVAGRVGAHDAHLFSNGCICFGSGGGLPTLEQAYAKSVLWTAGFSAYVRTGNFQFSNNN